MQPVLALKLWYICLIVDSLIRFICDEESHSTNPNRRLVLKTRTVEEIQRFILFSETCQRLRMRISLAICMENFAEIKLCQHANQNLCSMSASVLILNVFRFWVIGTFLLLKVSLLSLMLQNFEPKAPPLAPQNFCLKNGAPWFGALVLA